MNAEYSKIINLEPKKRNKSGTRFNTNPFKKI
jgi:hypothetical protein